MDLSNFETDRELEVGGVWVDIGDEDGTQLLVARVGNQKFNTMLRAKMKPYRNMLQRDILPQETQEGLLTEVLGETVLLGWKNLKHNGKEVKYSAAKAKELLKGIPDFRELVLEIGNSMETFRVVEEEEDIKNSKAS